MSTRVSRSRRSVAAWAVLVLGACGRAAPQPDAGVAAPAAHEAVLASGSGFSAHGDVWNLWDPAELQRRIETCLWAARKCNEAGNPI